MGKIRKVKNNLSLEFEDDVELMKKQIFELEKLKRIILDSPEYKMLDGKTQMIGAYKEQEYQNVIHSRGEHTECVAQIAKNIVTGIYEKFGSKEEQQTEIYQLNKKIAELYAEIMGYSHDLGHTPFGHVGESGLNEFMGNVSASEEIRQIVEHRRMMFGAEYEEEQGHSKSYDRMLSFEHNEQSAKVFYDIIKREKIDENLVDKKRVIWGILCHSTSRVNIEKIPDDIVVQSIRAADKIEYINKDYEELEPCLHLDEKKDSRIIDFVKDNYVARVSNVVAKVIDESFEYGRIDEEMNSMQILNALKKISDDCVRFVDTDGKRGLVKDENVERLKLISLKVAQYYYTHNEIAMYNDVAWKVSPINYNKEQYKLLGYQTLGAYAENKAEKVIKFVSSMDNARCEEIYFRLVRDRVLYGKGHGIEPITPNDISKKKKQQLIEVADNLKRENYMHKLPERIRESSKR